MNFSILLEKLLYMSETFYNTFVSFFDFVTLQIGELPLTDFGEWFLPQWIQDLSIFQLMFGGSIVTVLIVTLFKWVV